jgi:hypothetical protein
MTFTFALNARFILVDAGNANSGLNGYKIYYDNHNRLVYIFRYIFCITVYSVHEIAELDPKTR